MKPTVAVVAVTLLAVAPAASALAAVAATQPATPSASQPARSWEGYRILLDRNIFRRDRRVARPVTVTTRPRAEPAYDSDAGIVLTGIAWDDREFVAFFEDARTSAVVRARVGQAVGKGQVRRITLDDVEYGRGQAVSRIAIGRTLTGALAPRASVAPRASPPAPASSVPRASPPASPAPPAPDDDFTDFLDEPAAAAPAGPPATATAPAEPPVTTAPAAPVDSPRPATDADPSDILERMRRRREQELRR